jgi:putative ABC transport system permease protein
MPKRFSWSGVGGYAASDIYLPLKLSNDQNLMYPITARMKPGVSPERADAELQAMYKHFAKETPGRFSSDFTVHVVTLKESSVGSTKGTLFVLFGAVATLLAIGCINVGILFLARGVLRRNEFAVRSALGAQRARLIRQLLTESLVVALTGGLSGIPVALAGMALLMRWMPRGMLLPGVQINTNLPVLLFSILIALITGVCCGLRPALEFSRPVAGQMLADSTRSSTGSAGTKRLHLFLVVSQVAFAVLLLAAALAAVRTLVGLYKAKLGYDPKNVLVMGLPLMEGSYPSWSQRITYYEQIRHKLAHLPEVSSVAITSQQLPPIS